MKHAQEIHKPSNFLRREEQEVQTANTKPEMKFIQEAEKRTEKEQPLVQHKASLRSLTKNMEQHFPENYTMPQELNIEGQQIITPPQFCGRPPMQYDSNTNKQVTKPFCAVAKETILGLLKPLRDQVVENTYKQDPGNTQIQMSERERRIMLREIERKKRAMIGSGENGGYGQLSLAGANIVEQHHFSHDCDVDNKQSLKQIPSQDKISPVVPIAHNTSKQEDTQFPIVKQTDHAMDEERKKKEEYRKFLQKQINEQTEKKRFGKFETLPIEKPLDKVVELKKSSVQENFARFKKTDIDAEVAEKREQQKLLMQAELNRQVEERQKRKMMEKQKEKEEADKEEQRIRKEQAEIEAKFSIDSTLGGSSQNAKITKKQPIIKQNLFSPSVDNTFAQVVQGYNTTIKQAKIEIKGNAIAKPQEINEISEKESKYPEQKYTEQKKEENQTNLLEKYQKEIEALKNEKLQAKEEALLYKEQLLKARELQCQNMLAMLPQLVQKKTPQKVSKEPSNEESLECSSHRVPTSASNSSGNNVQVPVKCEDLFEQSLFSNTKLVAISETDRSMGELYKTWNPLAIQQQLTAKAAALKEQNLKQSTETAIQTTEDDHLHNFKAVEPNTQIEESIYFLNKN